MTQEQMDKMTEIERKRFFDSCKNFKNGQSLEAYTEDIRDYMYLLNRYVRRKNKYTIERANKEMQGEDWEIEGLFRSREPVGSAVIYVEYSCG